MKRYILGFVTVCALVMAGCQGCDNSTSAKSSEMKAINTLVDGQLEILRADLAAACMEDVIEQSDSEYAAQSAVNPVSNTTTITPPVIDEGNIDEGNIDGTNVGTTTGKKKDGTKTGTTTGKKK